MKIEITEFAKRHFDKGFGGTKILDMTPEGFTKEVQIHIDVYDDYNVSESNMKEGYAPFCKLFIMNNISDAKTGTLEITLANHQYLKSGYSARNLSELPVLSQWFEIPRMFIPKAKVLVVVLYTREQLHNEFLETAKPGDVFELTKSIDYGIVAILGQMEFDEEPMKPITMMRNALGKEHGGSGVEIDIETYKKSCDFWKKNATVK